MEISIQLYLILFFLVIGLAGMVGGVAAELVSIHKKLTLLTKQLSNKPSDDHESNKDEARNDGMEGQAQEPHKGESL